MDINYFDAQHVTTNTINHNQTTDLTNLKNDDIPELLDNDTGEKTQENIEQYIRYKDKLETIPEESDKDFPAMAQGDGDDGDTILYIQGDSEDEQFNTAINDTSDDCHEKTAYYRIYLSECTCSNQAGRLFTSN